MDRDDDRAGAAEAAARTACARATRRDRGAARGSAHAIRSSCERAGKSTASIPSGTSSGWRVIAAIRSPAAAAGTGSVAEKVPHVASRRPSACGQGRRRRRRRGSRELPPERLDEIGGAIPGERRGAFLPGGDELLAPASRLADPDGDRGRVERVDEHRRAAGDLLRCALRDS